MGRDMSYITKHRTGIDVKLFVIYTDNKIYSYYLWLGSCLHNDMTTAVQVLDRMF